MINNNIGRTKVELDAFTELRKRLKGQCGSSCPKNILLGYLRIGWCKIDRNFLCKTCDREFFWLKQGDNSYPCPCNKKINPEELFLRLDEFIAELQADLDKAVQ